MWPLSSIQVAVKILSLIYSTYFHKLMLLFICKLQMTVIYNPTVYLNAPIFIRISMMNRGPQQRRKRTITQMSILITYKRKYSNTFYCFNTNSSFYGLTIGNLCKVSAQWPEYVPDEHHPLFENYHWIVGFVLDQDHFFFSPYFDELEDQAQRDATYRYSSYRHSSCRVDVLVNWH